jgi:hypothetical protein
VATPSVSSRVRRAEGGRTGCTRAPRTWARELPVICRPAALPASRHGGCAAPPHGAPDHQAGPTGIRWARHDEASNPGDARHAPCRHDRTLDRNRDGRRAVRRGDAQRELRRLEGAGNHVRGALRRALRRDRQRLEPHDRRELPARLPLAALLLGVRAMRAPAPGPSPARARRPRSARSRATSTGIRAPTRCVSR